MLKTKALNNKLLKYGKLSKVELIFNSNDDLKILLGENSKNIENVYVELYSYNYIDCQNNRKVCPICKGTSVMIIETDVSKIYKTCPFSDNKGFLTCDEYNLFLRGKLKPKTSN